MKRIVSTIILFLLLVSGGAVVNVAVAWGLLSIVDVTTSPEEYAHGGLRGPLFDGDQRSLPYAGCVAYRRGGIGTERVTLDVLILHGGPPGPRRTSNPSVEDLLPSWGTRCLTQESDSDSGRSPFHMATWTTVEGRGWPRLSMWGGVTDLRPGHWIKWPEDFDGERLPWVHGAVLLEPTPPGCKTFGGCATIVPLRPIWPGFLVNTIFYALILWLLIPGPFALRRLIRIRRGCCPKCGYDLRGQHDAGCPECGWNRQPEATA